ncbi:MAG: adenylate/guanylate cyclase domain-containing protein [Parvularculaceae bacterium]|nr:adenylate/guanylate cyclase domain-containing protein [Parvularculaceae bacterium]
MRWLKALPLVGLTVVLAALAISTLANAQSRNGGLREQLFDLYARLSPADIPAVSPFEIIRIDRESIERIGPWPWPRSLLGDLVTAADGAGAKGVVLAVGVDRPDPLSPQTIGDFWLAGARDNVLAEQLALLPKTDLVLARAFTQTDGAIALGDTAGEKYANDLILERADISLANGVRPAGAAVSPYYGLPAARAQFPVNSDLAASAALTVSALPADRDGVVRSATLLWSVAGKPAPLTALEAARIAAGASSITITPDDSAVSAVGQTLRSVSIGAGAIPVSPQGAIRIYPPRRLDNPSISAWKLLDSGTSLGQLSGKVVIIGLDKEIGGAIKTTRGEYANVDVHTLIARQLAAGQTLARPGWIGYLEAIAVMLLGAAAIMWSQRLEFWKATGVAAALSVTLLLISLAAASFSGTLFDPISPSLALFLGAFSVAGGRSLGVVLKDDNVRGSFQGSLPEPTMKKVREEGSTELLGGALRPVTVLACELRLLDEDIERIAQTPAEVTNVIAAGSVHLKKAIIDAGGAADQAEGGKLFAYFNAPLENADHVRAGCSAALRLVESMDKINAEIEAAPRTRDVQLHLAIGIATGECFVGPMGHGRANRYSAVGKPVELAAFLSRQAAHYGPAIICDETVHRKTHHHFAFLELDRLRERDAERAFNIFALVGNPFIKSSKGYRALEESHRAMLTAYREGDYLTARAHLNKAKQSPGARIALFDIYEDRIMAMADQGGAPESWDGAQIVTF